MRYLRRLFRRDIAKVHTQMTPEMREALIDLVQAWGQESVANRVARTQLHRSWPDLYFAIQNVVREFFS